MKSLAALTLAALICAPAAAHDDWTNADTARQAAFFATSLVDLAQTRWIADHPSHCEYNPLLGRHPSSGRVGAYFAAAAAAHTLIAYSLPADWRHGFQYVTIGAELSVVTHNARVGIRLEF
jgi:hypothetical protein